VPYWITVTLANAFTRHCQMTGGELNPRTAFRKVLQTCFIFACSVSLTGDVFISTETLFFNIILFGELPTSTVSRDNLFVA
jgi:hypothetical protein